MLRLRGLLGIAALLSAAAAGSPHSAALVSSPPAQSTSLTARPIARSPIDVIQTTLSSFMTVGSVGFVWTTTSSLFKRTAFGAACAAGAQTAQRWGRVSAGFAGGQALGQVIRRADDTWCSVLGAVAGGVAAATSVAEIPQSVGSFVLFTMLLENLAKNSSQSGEPSPQSSKSLQQAREEARLRARQDFERRHSGDEVRLRAVRAQEVHNQQAGQGACAAETNVFGEPIGAGFKPGSRVRAWVDERTKELGQV